MILDGTNNLFIYLFTPPKYKRSSSATLARIVKKKKIYIYMMNGSDRTWWAPNTAVPKQDT